MHYFGFHDLLKRWIYSRQGLYKLIASRGFPAPVFTLNQGRTKVWARWDIEAYEKQHPEVTDEAAKQFKVKGYYLTISKGRKAKTAS